MVQVRDSEIQILYGLFKSICEWAAAKGVNDVSALKDLLKQAMVEVYMGRHVDLSPHRAHTATAIDLGISIRNVETSLRKTHSLDDISPGFIRLQPLLRRISFLLVNAPQTVDDLISEVSPLIHAPYDLQKSIIHSIMNSLEQACIVYTEVREGRTYYAPVGGHLILFYPGDSVAKLSGMIAHIEAYEHMVCEPFLRIFHLSSDQARLMQAEAAKTLRDIGTAREKVCREQPGTFKSFYFLLGSTPLEDSKTPPSVSDVILRNTKLRFADPASPSMASTHWYDLTRECANQVFHELTDFIEREGAAQNHIRAEKGTAPYAFYMGLADLRF
jgi:hypothetical protein